MERYSNAQSVGAKDQTGQLNDEELISPVSPRASEGAYSDPSKANLHTGQQEHGEIGDTPPGTPEEQKPGLGTPPPEPVVGADADGTALAGEQGQEWPRAENSPGGRPQFADGLPEVSPVYPNAVSGSKGTVAFADPLGQIGADADQSKEMPAAVDSKSLENTPALGQFDEIPVASETPPEVQENNEAQTDIALDNVSLTENVSGAVVGQLSLLDPDASDSHAFTVSDNRFEVADGALKLKDGISLDHEAEPLVEVTVTATDTGGRAVSETFDVTVADVNEAPVSITLAENSQARGGAGTSDALSANVTETDVGVFKTSDLSGDVGVIDVGDRAKLYTIDLNKIDALSVIGKAGKNAPELHEIMGIGQDGKGYQNGELGLVDNETGAIDAELKALIEKAALNADVEDANIRLKEIGLDDGTTYVEVEVVGEWSTDVLRFEGDQLESTLAELSDIEAISAALAKSRDTGPSALDAGSVAENVSGAVVGQLSVLDPDVGDSHAFTVSDDRFEVADGALKLKDGISLDHEAEPLVEVTVTATDTGGLAISETFDVAVADVNEAPTTINLSVPEPSTTVHLTFESEDAGWSNSIGVARLDENGNPVDGQIVWSDSNTVPPGSTSTVQFEGGAAEGVVYFLIPNGARKNADIEDGTDVQFAQDSNGSWFAQTTDGTPLAGQRADVLFSGDGSLNASGFDQTIEEGGSISFEDIAGGGDRDFGDVVLQAEVEVQTSALQEGVTGSVVGALSVTEPDKGDVHAFSVSDDRFEVDGAVLRLKEGIALNDVEGSQLSVEVTATDTGGRSVSETFQIDVEPVPDLDLSSGFHAKYFDVDRSLSHLDDVDWTADPTFEDLRTDINYTNSSSSFWEGGDADTFGVEITGSVTVEQGGVFNFHLAGDDGAVLYVNGVEVVNNDGLHRYDEKSGQVELSAGTHHIEVRYFENYGHAGLKLEWDGPGMDGRQLVETANGAQLHAVAGTPLGIELSDNNAVVPEDSHYRMDGLPEGTQVILESRVFEVGETGSLVLENTGSDLAQIVPPSDFVGDIAVHVTALTYGTSGEIAHAQGSVSIQVTAAEVPPLDLDITGGFKASFFDVDHSLRVLSDVDWSADPTHEDFVSEIDFQNSAGSFWEEGSQDTFGARFEGAVTVEEGGTYTFWAGGDDGVVVFVNGQEVVNNDSLHAYETSSGQVELPPGTHEIEIRYFENYGHAGLKIEWVGPDTNGRETIKPDPQTAIDANSSLDIGLSMGNASDSATVEVTGLPPDTILMSGENSAVSSGDPVDVSDWDLSHIEIVPPFGFEGAVEGEITVTDQAFNGSIVESAVPFAVTVGDQDVDQAGEQLVLAANDQAAPGLFTDEANEMAALEEMDSLDQGSIDDVVSAPAIQPASSEFSEISMDSHERIDW